MNVVIVLSMISQTQKDKYHMFFAHVWNADLKTNMGLLISDTWHIFWTLASYELSDHATGLSHEPITTSFLLITFTLLYRNKQLVYFQLNMSDPHLET
jgi:hypothetical protein